LETDSVKTDDLIRALSADLNVQKVTLETRYAAIIVPGLMVAVALFAITLGPRPDFMTAVYNVRFDFKFLVTLLLALSSLALLWRLVCPGAETKVQTAFLLLVPTALALGVAAELFVLPRTAWMMKMIGQNGVLCLVSIPFFALPILIATLVALRQGAPMQLGLTGAVAGLFSGGIGGAIYAAHCPDDSPLFLALWYTLAITSVVLLGWLAGRRVLRW
jgi:hypothetical protein